MREYHKSKPIHTALRKQAQKGDSMTISYGEMFEQLLAHACPYGPDPYDDKRPNYREFVFDLHCSTALVTCSFVSYNKDTQRYKYEIHSVTIGCESMMDGCTQCATVVFDNLERG